MVRYLILALGLLFLCVGCNGDDDDDSVSGDDDATPDDDDDDATPDDDDATADDDDDATPPTFRGSCALDVKVGAFLIQHEPEYTVISGEVRDGVVPSAVLENVLEEDDCRLLMRNNPFCDPPCQPDETCDLDGDCIPYPINLDVGTVTITGLNKEVTMEPPGGGLPAMYYDTQMPHPGFDPGADIRLSASGNEIDGFELYGEGFAPLEIVEEPWIVRPGEPMEVHWTAATGEQVRILLRFNIDQHGTTPVEVWCDVEDTGSFSTPSSVMDALIGYGVTGFPTGNIYRRSVDSVDVETGCVELEVSSHLTGDLQVEGHIPCDSPDDCPKGMECDFMSGTCI
jgi:hypothetical protein